MNGKNRRSGFLQNVIMGVVVLLAIWAYGEWKSGRLQVPDNDLLPVLMTPAVENPTPVLQTLPIEATPEIVEFYPAEPTVDPEKQKAVQVAVQHVEFAVTQLQECYVRQAGDIMTDQHCENYELALKNIRQAAENLIKEINQ